MGRSPHSQSHAGFPRLSGALLPGRGRAPLILIEAALPTHPHNLQKDPKCSMLVGERGAPMMYGAPALAKPRSWKTPPP